MVTVILIEDFVSSLEIGLILVSFGYLVIWLQDSNDNLWSLGRIVAVRFTLVVSL